MHVHIAIREESHIKLAFRGAFRNALLQGFRLSSPLFRNRVRGRKRYKNDEYLCDRR